MKMYEDFMDEVFDNTAEIAYMYDRFGANNWRDVIVFFERKNFNAKQTIAFLRSKHVRWAIDASEYYTGERKACVDVIHEYFGKYPQYSTPEYANGLIEEDDYEKSLEDE